MKQKTTLVCGAGGFIGSHMVKRLKKDGFWVRGVDLKYPEFSPTQADDFIIGDLRDPFLCKSVVDQPFDEVYQFAADMGGAGFVFTGDNDADILYNSAMINLNMLNACQKKNVKRVFFSSSACIYPEKNTFDPKTFKYSEETAYPANPDSEYGWEKLFSERLYLAYRRNYGLETRVARYHNIFGPEGAWKGGREKAPAALSRKVAEALLKKEDYVEVWGNGRQMRTFLYIDECIEATILLMRSEVFDPLNIGSEELVSINQLIEMIMEISGKKLTINHISGPLGVEGRSSQNDLIYERLGWRPSQPLRTGMEKTYQWVCGQVNQVVKKHG